MLGFMPQYNLPNAVASMFEEELNAK